MVIYTKKVKNEELTDFIKDSVVLIDVKAEWCGPCKQLGPIVDEVSSELFPSVKVGVIDADENMDFCKENNVRNIPTLLLFKDGVLKDRMTGLKNKTEILEFVNSNS